MLASEWYLIYIKYFSIVIRTKIMQVLKNCLKNELTKSK